MRALFALVSIPLFSIALFGQSNDVKCPTISVIGPAGLTNPGDSLTFIANVSGGDALQPTTYSWTISTGIIVSGQGTASIVVATTKEDAGVNITATVELEGFPAKCTKTASETVGIAARIHCGLPADEYENIPWLEERIHYDSLLIQLIHNPESKAFIKIEIGSNETLDTTKKHIVKILKFVRSRNKDFNLGRFTFAIRKRDEPGRTTKVWLFSPEAEMPECGENCTIINGRDLLP